MLPGLIAIPSGANSTPPDLSYLSSTSSTSSLTTYTFAGQTLGAASTGRYIVVVATVSTAAAGITINSMTIGGVAATEIVEKVGTGGTANRTIAIYIAKVPTGTTGDIEFTCSTTGVRCALAWWRLEGIPSTAAAATASGTTSADINVSANDIVIVGAHDNSTTAMTPTGYTERVDIAYGVNRFEAGDYTATANETPRTISCATPLIMVAATWRR